MPFFVSEERIDEMTSKARLIGYQEGYSDGQQNGEQTAYAQCLEFGYQFRVAFEVELNQPQLLPRPNTFHVLIDQLQSVLRDARQRWERSERNLETYQRVHNPETWQALTAEIRNSQEEVEGLTDELAHTHKQLDSARHYNEELERKIRDLERVVVSLQNTLDRANKQGK